MLNQVVLVGRLTKIKKEKTENGANKVVITLATPQSFKNVDGCYDTNFINCVLFGQVAESTIDYCKKGDLIGIKGRLQRIDTSKPIEIIADKVMFLSSRKESEEE